MSIRIFSFFLSNFLLETPVTFDKDLGDCILQADNLRSRSPSTGFYLEHSEEGGDLSLLR